MLVDAVVSLVAAADAALAERVKRAADLSELVRTGQWPASPVAAFVLPLGLRPRSEGDAAAGAFIQAVDESVGVLLVVSAAADPTGGKALPAIDALVEAVIAGVAGQDVGNSAGVLRLARGALISAEAGRVIYQIDFSIHREVRILS